jgi:hypothetical protein
VTKIVAVAAINWTTTLSRIAAIQKTFTFACVTSERAKCVGDKGPRAKSEAFQGVLSTQQSTLDTIPHKQDVIRAVVWSLTPLRKSTDRIALRRIMSRWKTGKRVKRGRIAGWGVSTASGAVASGLTGFLE